MKSNTESRVQLVRSLHRDWKWDGMLLVSLSNPAYKKFEGRRMNEVIQTIGGKALRRALQDSGRQWRIGSHHLLSSRRERHAVRASSSRSSPSFGTARLSRPADPRRVGIRIHATTAPSRAFLAATCATRRCSTLEDAVRKMTSLNAVKIHIHDRGMLRAVCGGCDSLRSGDHHRQCHVGQTSPVRYRSPLRAGKRKAGHRRGRAHRCASGNHTVWSRKQASGASDRTAAEGESTVEGMLDDGHPGLVREAADLPAAI